MTGRMKLKRIFKTHCLTEAAEAMQHLEHGHARGKIVITVNWPLI